MTIFVCPFGGRLSVFLIPALSRFACTNSSLCLSGYGCYAFGGDIKITLSHGYERQRELCWISLHLTMDIYAKLP